MILSIKKFLQQFYIYILIFCLGLGLRIYALNTSPHLQIDEPCSYTVATPLNKLDNNTEFKENWYTYQFETGKNYTAQEIQNALFAGKGGIKGIVKDLYALRKNNLDRQHPILYYSTLRIWNSVLGDFSFDKYLMHGRCLNLVFYCFSYLFLYLLLKNINNDKRFISLCLFFAFTNTGGIMLDTEAREYALMEMLLIMSTYFCFDICKKIYNNDSIRCNLIILSSIVFSLFMLSGYFSLIYLSILAISTWFVCIVSKRWKYLPVFFGIILLSCAITFLIYPDYYNFSYNNEHYSSVKSSFQTLLLFDNIKDKIPHLLEHLNKYIFYNIIILLINVILIIQFVVPLKNEIREPISNKETKIILSIFGISFIWAIIITLLQPFIYYSRYIMPAVALFAFLTALIAYRLKSFMLFSVLFLYMYTGVMQIVDERLVDCDRIMYGNNNAVYYAKSIFCVKKNTPGQHVVNDKIPIVFADAIEYVVGQYLFANVSNKNIVRFEKDIPPAKYIFKEYLLICNEKKLKNKPIYTIRGDLAVYHISNKHKIDKNNDTEKK